MLIPRAIKKCVAPSKADSSCYHGYMEGHGGLSFKSFKRIIVIIFETMPNFFTLHILTGCILWCTCQLSMTGCVIIGYVHWSLIHCLWLFTKVTYNMEGKQVQPCHHCHMTCSKWCWCWTVQGVWESPLDMQITLHQIENFNFVLNKQDLYIIKDTTRLLEYEYWVWL